MKPGQLRSYHVNRNNSVQQEIILTTIVQNSKNIRELNASQNKAILLQRSISQLYISHTTKPSNFQLFQFWCILIKIFSFQNFDHIYVMATKSNLGIEQV